MNDLKNALWIELRKAARSRLPLVTGLACLIMPLACGFLMFVYKDPEFARELGLVSAKANLVGGSADWPFYLSMFSQGMSVVGLMLFSIINSWVFGREFADGTLKDLLAVPVPRGTILLAKFIVAALWSIALTLFIYVLGILLGAGLGLAQGSPEVVLRGSLTLAITALLVLLTITPAALLASIGRGYLLPIGIILLMVGVGNLVALVGWGAYYPWAIPMMYAGLAAKGQALEPASYGIVVLTGLAGMAGTYWWWKTADQSR